MENPISATEPRARRRRWLLGALALLVLLAWLAFRDRGEARPAAVEAASPRPPGLRANAAHPSPIAATASTPATDGTPIIDEVVVEKSEVCEGEENLITVKAHTPDGTDAFLHYTLAGDTGNPRPIRLHLNDDGTVPPAQLLVFGKDNLSAMVALPPIRVKRCPLVRRASIAYQGLANVPGGFGFQAEVVQLGADPETGPFAPVEYRWSFGDDTRTTTAVPYVEHSYQDRRQDTLYSQLRVQVEVVGQSGETVLGRRTIQLMNPAFEELAQKGIVKIMEAQTPRFPVLADDGRVRVTVRLWHLEPEPVVIQTIRKVTFGAVGGRHDGEGTREWVSTASVLGTEEIPAGRGVEIAVELNTDADPEALWVNYYLEGTSADGLPARGSFSVMRPPRPPTRDHHDALIHDPVLMAKVIAAREILQRDIVTDEDLFRLQREGKFANLRVDPRAVPPPPDEARVRPPSPPPRGDRAR